MKKIGLLFATIIMMVLFAVSASAVASTGQCGENVYWNFNKETGELVISGEGDMYESVINFCFSAPETVKSVVIENGVMSIGRQTFDKCVNLESVIIADSVTSIGSHAFRGCVSLSDIEIPDSVTYLGEGSFDNTAFYNDKDNWDNGLLILDGWIIGLLTDYVYIPADVKAVEEFLFAPDIPVIKFFEVDDNNEFLSSDECGVLYNKDKTKLIAFPQGSKITTYTVPYTVESFYMIYSFYLETLVIPDTVKHCDWMPVSFSFKDVYIYSDDLELAANDLLCYHWIDQEKWFEVREEYYDACEEFVAIYISGDYTEEELEEAEARLSEVDNFYTSKENPYGTIHANEGSTVHAYANRLGIDFKPLNASATESKDIATGSEVYYAPHTFNSEVEFVVKTDGGNANTAFGDEYANYKSYDISFVADGKAVQPNGNVTVKLPLPSSFNAESIAVYYVDNNGNKTKLDSKVEDGFVVFDTNHFSEYVIVDESSKVEEPAPGDPVVPEEPTPEDPTEPDTPEEPADTDTPADSIENCSCNCHKDGIAGFFFKLINFFQKLFGKNKICICGVKH